MKMRRVSASYVKAIRKVNVHNEEFWSDYQNMLYTFKTDPTYKDVQEFERKWSKIWQVPAEAIRSLANTPRGIEIKKKTIRSIPEMRIKINNKLEELHLAKIQFTIMELLKRHVCVNGEVP
jgi:hypothetical protein